MNKQTKKVCYAARATMKQISKCPDSSIMKEVLGDLSKTMKLLKTEETLEQMDMLVNAVKCLRYNQLPGCKNTSLFGDRRFADHQLVTKMQF